MALEAGLKSNDNELSLIRPCEIGEGVSGSKRRYLSGRDENVALETCRDENKSITRPGVRPLEYFSK